MAGRRQNNGVYNTYGSLTENGVLFPVLERSALNPTQAPAPYYQGRGAPPPTIAGSFQSGGYNGTMVDVSDVSSGPDSSGPANTVAAEIAALDPFNPAVSPVVWAIVFLFVGLLGLRYVHWRG